MVGRRDRHGRGGGADLEGRVAQGGLDGCRRRSGDGGGPRRRGALHLPAASARKQRQGLLLVGRDQRDDRRRVRRLPVRGRVPLPVPGPLRDPGALEGPQPRGRLRERDSRADRRLGRVRDVLVLQQHEHRAGGQGARWPWSQRSLLGVLRRPLGRRVLGDRARRRRRRSPDVPQPAGRELRSVRHHGVRSRRGLGVRQLGCERPGRPESTWSR